MFITKTWRRVISDSATEKNLFRSLMSLLYYVTAVLCTCGLVTVLSCISKWATEGCKHGCKDGTPWRTIQFEKGQESAPYIFKDFRKSGNTKMSERGSSPDEIASESYL